MPCHLVAHTGKRDKWPITFRSPEIRVLGSDKSSWLRNALLKQYPRPSAIGVREPRSYDEGATRPEAWTAAASRFAAEPRDAFSGRAAGSGHAFPCNCGVSCPVSRRLSGPFKAASLVTAATC